MRRLIALVVLAGCASTGAPPGGPERHTPPEIVSVTPDSGQLSAAVKEVEFKFDEVVSDRAATAGGGTLDQIVLVSPRIGSTDVSWHRSRITVRPKNGFRPNTAYSVTLLPGLVDLRGNSRKDSRTIVFSTGAAFPPFTIPGRVFDWTTGRVAANAYIEAISQADTSVAYLAASDSLGQFDVGPLPAGSYLLRALIDQNANRVVDRNEKWDSLTVLVQSVRGYQEMDAIERDSVPARIDNVQTIDSLTLRVSFDKPLDPRIPLQPALVGVKRADSTDLEVTRVAWAAAFDAARAAFIADSMKRADSVRAASRPNAAPPPPVAPPIALPGGARNPPPPPKPQRPAPDRAIIVTLSPSTPVRQGQTYVLRGNGFRNLVGHVEPVHYIFSPPKPVPRDTSKTPPPPAKRDSVRPPGARPPFK